jgi:hypothetical protein
MRRYRFILPALALLAAPAPAAERPARSRTPEWAVWVRELVLGDPMKGGSSPLWASKTHYGWPALASRHGIGPAGAIPKARFRGPADLFARLDRDGNGVLVAADLDWSDQSRWVQQQALTSSLFNRLDRDRDGALTAKEWQAVFDRLAEGKKGMTPDDLKRALFPPPGRSTVTRPHRVGLLLGLFAGELGSLCEGPDPGAVAPDFVLRSPDGKRAVRLADYRGHKPVVLIFGNFT